MSVTDGRLTLRVMDLVTLNPSYKRALNILKEKFSETCLTIGRLFIFLHKMLGPYFTP